MVPISGITATVFQHVLEFVYNPGIMPPAEFALDMLAAANHFNLKDLKDACALVVEEVCHVYVSLMFHYIHMQLICFFYM